MMDDILAVGLILVGSVVVHEFAHAVVADWFGDPTARRLGRLTLNPIPHLDPIGSVILPMLILFLGSPIWFAWAKPVPVNPSYFSSPKSGMMWVALAGPLSNITLAVLASILLRVVAGAGDLYLISIVGILHKMIYMNVGLAVFNLLPIPPLDGSRIVSRFLNGPLLNRFQTLEPYGFFIVLALSFFGLLNPIVWGPTRTIFRYLVLGI